MNTTLCTLVRTISYLLCLLFAWIINEFSSRIRTELTLIFYAPSICGNAYMVWSLILSGDRYGYLNGILLKWGIINEQKLDSGIEFEPLPVSVKILSAA